MEIIVLQGLPYKGKTTTIGLVYDLVINGGGVSTNKKLLGADPNDFSDVVINYKNKEIAFYSMGDVSTALSKAIYQYDKQGCDLIICALSTGTPKIRANNALNKYRTIRLNKTVSSIKSLEISSNKSDAQQIFSII